MEKLSAISDSFKFGVNRGDSDLESESGMRVDRLPENILTTASIGFLFALYLTVTGCGGGDGLDRREVRGTVMYQNQPITKGTITLFPLGSGTVASTSIDNGNYRIEQATGPTPGEYRVEITALEKTGEVIRIEEPGVEPIEILKEVSSLPARYNDQSELTMTVDANDAVTEFDFALE